MNMLKKATIGFALTTMVVSAVVSNLSSVFAQTSLVPLKLYWSPQRGDNFTTATTKGEQDALAAGYTFARIEACALPKPEAGTVPLKLYWSPQRGDNFTTATTKGEQDALAAGYTFARVEGYAFTKQVAGTVPLKLYWSPQRGDNFTTATTKGEQDALAAGYTFARVEGYVYPNSRCDGSATAQAKTDVVVRMTTGSDDLRGDGNHAFISLNLTNGSSTPEVNLGGGFNQNSVVERRVTFTSSEPISLNQIRSVTIRHDGRPRSRHPFDNYDEWDLQRISVSFADGRNIYNSVNDPAKRSFVQRFNGQTRQIVLPRQ
ncbi:hypothetical protein [Anabaena sp. UHCC 0399]|uniref:hypothetical protein n=1 Tax=Anabaena sp. UHCC 0399 TaxID=3110238 RepID=UPI002B202656|nr:hypothetical protein [Anabaena sp. UHCC 0399]MEA5569180.1 hypothetical protein [Anabaena sp. UHCC 0399]